MSDHQQSSPVVFDGHNDTLHLLAPFRDDDVRRFLDGLPEANIDLPRARAGDLGGGFFAVFASSPGGMDVRITADGYEIPRAEPLDPIDALRANLAMMAGLFRLERISDGRVRIIRDVAGLRAARQDGAIAAVLHLEGADSIDPDFHALELFHRAGLRSLGITWSRPNIFGHGVPFRFPADPDTGPGLTGHGRELVRACNRLGILVDLSHLNAAGFRDVADMSDAPLVATHSAVHALCPLTRNLTDWQIDAIGASGGMVGVNFEVSATRADGYDRRDTPLSVIVDHIDYIARRIGIDHVGFGSDFDGATMPSDLRDAAGLPRLIDALRERGYGEADIAKITWGNWERVLGATWHHEPASI